MFFTLLLLQWMAWSIPSPSNNEIPETQGAQLLAPGIVSTTNGEYHPSFDAQNQTLYFMRRTPGRFDYTILASRKVGKNWSKAEVLPFSGRYRDAAPTIAPGGKRLFFDSRRPTAMAPRGSINLWYVEQEDGQWGDPVYLQGPSENAPSEPAAGLDEFGPTVDGQGNLYFYAFRQPYRGGAHYVSRPPNYATAELNPGLPDPSASTFVSYAYLSEDGQFALLEGRAPGRRDTDIFCSCQGADGNWSEAYPLTEVNTAAGEGGPSLSSDGQYLFFTSNRSVNDQLAGNANLYWIPTQQLNIPCQPQP